MLVKFPQEEQGKGRKLSHPWHGPYRVVSRNDPDVTVTKVYYPQEGSIQIHQERVCFYPPEFPAGYFWYGKRRHVVGRPPKWVQALLQKGTAEFHGEPDPKGADESRGDPDPPRSDESLTNGGVVDPDNPSLQRSDESLAEGSVADPASTFEFGRLLVEEPIREPTTFQFDSLAGDETVSSDEDEDPPCLEREPETCADTPTLSDASEIARPHSDPSEVERTHSDSSTAERPFSETGKRRTETERPHSTALRRRVQAPARLMSLQSLPKARTGPVKAGESKLVSSFSGGGSDVTE